MGGVERVAAWVAASAIGWPAAVRGDGLGVAALRVSAELGPSSVEIEVDGGFVRVTSTFGPTDEALQAVAFTLPDGTRTPGGYLRSGEWSELWDDAGPTRLAREGVADVPAVRLARR